MKPNKLQTKVINDEIFFKISDVDDMRPFFMTIVSDSNHWMFLSSNGGISAGRKSAETALFPYYTDDKITESADITGSKTIFQIKIGEEIKIWEPFSARCEAQYSTSKNLYKNEFGNKIIFEEINHDLNLTFSYEWNSSDRYGFIKKSKILNNSKEIKHITLLDGFQNILPYGIESEMQIKASNLADAYKRAELDAESGLAYYALSAIIVDKAEPSEALKANTVFSIGLDNPQYLLSSLQLNNFRNGIEISQEKDVKGEKCAYFISETIVLKPENEKAWLFVADVNQSQSSVVQMLINLKDKEKLITDLQKDISKGTKNLVEVVASADGIQYSANNFDDSRHFSNVLFNVMRGGIFDENYQIEKKDFLKYLKKANKAIYEASSEYLAQLPTNFSVFELQSMSEKSNIPDLIRLSTEYLPLKFSRRHGDPSRPWNKFSINTRNENGEKNLDYEGNWRDIFQNWEALAYSYPYFVRGMIFKFLNATTFDGYNPYRVTKDGFDWETIDPDDSWSYIGYWGDHQIIYLLKFLELSEKYHPGSLERLLDKDLFVYAHVPYRIKSYEDIVKNPKDTIVFRHDEDTAIRKKRTELGGDGSLRMADEKIYYTNLTEKLLATILSKLSNFVPEGGIWMNTQRPEWNDANNALVGNGVSMVTLYYLRRFLKFLENLLTKTSMTDFKISVEMRKFFDHISEVFRENQRVLRGTISDNDRKHIVDQLGIAGSDYRNEIYKKGLSVDKTTISVSELLRFFGEVLKFLDHSILMNQRDDGLYHAYNLLSFKIDTLQISHLEEMLEGQVAVLSSGFLSAEESIKVLDSLKTSALYRADQDSYILYPNKNLKGFLERNIIPKEVFETESFAKIANTIPPSIIAKDANGNYRFNGSFKNANDLKAALDIEDRWEENEKIKFLEVFELTFTHKAFTGRSGTFYGYEGLGSIYWHMVSKLLLAVKEIYEKAVKDGVPSEALQKLAKHFYEIKDGIGVHKTPKQYGAFPTDAYSHTPAGKGAQQPGMTGQVKEDILSRMGELGLMVNNGAISFNPKLLRTAEFLKQDKSIFYVDVNGRIVNHLLKTGQVFYTVCQVPIIYELSDASHLEITDRNGDIYIMQGNTLDKESSTAIFKRDGSIKQIRVFINKSGLS